MNKIKATNNITIQRYIHTYTHTHTQIYIYIYIYNSISIQYKATISWKGLNLRRDIDVFY